MVSTSTLAVGCTRMDEPYRGTTPAHEADQAHTKAPQNHRRTAPARASLVVRKPVDDRRHQPVGWDTWISCPGSGRLEELPCGIAAASSLTNLVQRHSLPVISSTGQRCRTLRDRLMSPPASTMSVSACAQLLFAIDSSVLRAVRVGEVGTDSHRAVRIVHDAGKSISITEATT